MSRRHIVGQLFFTKTTFSKECKKIVTNFMVLLERDKRRAYFQQDGARAPVCGDTLEFLGNFFHDRLISWKTEPHWPADSPGLSNLSAIT